MNTEKNIFIAFLLNFAFAVFEFFGGIFTGSVAILSDAVHDLGDALGIALSFVLEKKSKRPPDATYTYGYARHSVLGGTVTTLILLIGSGIVIVHAVERLLHPTPIRYDSMILFAVVGVAVNLLAAFFTREGDSINQKAVNLHMLEDVLAWGMVLIGAIVMKLTQWDLLDPLLSIGVALFIFFHAAKSLRAILDLFLVRVPHSISMEELQAHVRRVEGVVELHHVHVWSLDGVHHCATLHAVIRQDRKDTHDIKDGIRAELRAHGITHATLELESEGEPCCEEHCRILHEPPSGHHHHHHHHG